ncbi:MAG: type II toxin-antitoxin system VapC family toxin [Dehalococcoidia bacterium]
MRLLIDSHVWVWLTASPGRLNPATFTLLSEPGNEVLLSIASCWELAIKQSLGRLAFPGDIVTRLPELVAEQGIALLPITLAHAMAVAALPYHHRDPFDRLIIAQSQLEGLSLVTADPAIEPYGVQLIPA